MRILVVSQYYWPEPFRLADICEELTARGHEVHVLTDLPNYPEGIIHSDYRLGRNRLQHRNGVTIHRVFTIGRRRNVLFRVLNYHSFSLAASAWAGRTKEKFDVILAYQASPVMMAEAALTYREKHRIPVLLYCMDLWPASLRVGGIRDDSMVYRVYHRISGRIYRGVDEIAVSSRGFTEHLCREFGLKPEKISYVPQYADHVFAFPEKRAEEPLHLVFAGNVGTAQSIPTILEAARLLKGTLDVVWHIVGGGTALEQCRAHAGENGLDNVLFHGYQTGDTLQGFYEKADAMLITLTADPVISLTLPMKVMSYLASGKAVIAAADGEIAHVIGEAGCGYCAPAEDPQALAEAVLRFARDPQRDSFGIRGRAYYLAHFARDRFMDEMESRLLALTEKGRGV